MPITVLDTTVASFIHNRDSRASHYAPHLRGEILVLSAQTVGEMLRGARSANWGQRKLQALDQFILGFVVQDLTSQVAGSWAELMDESRRRGRSLSSMDAWVAATAKELQATLVTHDADFDAVSCPGLTIVQYDDAGVRIQ